MSTGTDLAVNVKYLEFAEEPVDGALAHSVNPATVQRDESVRFAIFSGHFFQTHQALPSLQQHI